MITIRHIRQVTALDRFGSFRRAAEALCLSQPALSRSILTLEEKLGVKIFDRTGGKIVPTRYGAIILEKGEMILNDIDLLNRDITLLQGGEKGVVSIGCGPVPAEVLASETIGRFNNIYPRMSVRLKVDYAPRLAALLSDRLIDFFVADSFPAQDGPREFRITPLPQQQGYFCCRKGHPLTLAPSPTVEEIFAFPLALMWVPKRVLTLFGTLLQKDIRDLEDCGDGFVQCDNLNTLLRIVAHGDAFTIITREILDKTNFRGELCLLPLEVPGMTTDYSIFRLEGSTPVDALSRLHDLFVEVAEEVVCKERM